MASSILRWISKKAAANSPNFVLRLIDAVKNSLLRGWFDQAKNSTPLLMQPPSFEGNDNNTMLFNFYSFADNTVRKVFNQRVGILASNDIKFVSSSHGWLALFNSRTRDLFLYNPLSGSQIKLPPIHMTIDIHEEELTYVDEDKLRTVTKVITSCSPEQQDCIVMMSCGQRGRLAYCSLTITSKWTPIGPLYEKDHKNRRCTIVYNDFAYCSRKKRFYTITNYSVLQAWDLEEIGSPKRIKLPPQPSYKEYCPVAIKSEEDIRCCRSFVSLVVVEETGQLFWVRRYFLPYNADMTMLMAVPFTAADERKRKPRYKTTAFDVYKYDDEKGGLKYMDGSLDGLAFFMGNGRGFAIPASKFRGDEVQANSIYFTDGNALTPEHDKDRSYAGGGHESGVFNYEDKTFSSVTHYPGDGPPPMWFTPPY